ncbi:YgaP family membrane protein [Paludisphaera mucosa]|uniref:DUF2892 domain-containing protein n=1 Tax=Paludisphaera mucosa TaxID=3030827 RepID=A0ABT6FK89_9BACT|nr:DUF2892 domain-containing protein [Paludisphaera mucosa]MDG3007986.1 DUF2892 domain-containing protein [Paludisphaera mucosa]
MAQNTISQNKNQPQGNSHPQGQEQAPLQESCAMKSHEGGLQALLGGHAAANVGDVERVVSVMGGGLLTLFGATRGGLAGLGLAVLGGGLIYRGVTGHCEAYHSLGIDTTDSAAKANVGKPGHAHS